MKKILLFIFICPFFLFNGCKDDSDSEGWVDAIVVYLGDPAADGCGWSIEINGTTTIPDFLPDQYKEDGLKLSIKYENTAQTYDCPGFNFSQYPIVTISKIKK